MAGQTQKLKILYLMRILLEKTDEDHIMSAKDLSEELEKYDVKSERKSIYADIEALKDFGLDIIQVKGAKSGYYIASRDFELPELKLLVDAVQSSKFITSRKTDELIKKLEKLTSRSEAKQLQRQVFIYNRAKTGNETIYYNVDHLHNALSKNRKITFQYAEWNTGKKLQLRRNGELYKVSPWALTWEDENYYLVAFEEKSNALRHYRVDKMKNIQMTEEVRQGKELFEKFDLALFAKKTFGMYGGTDVEVVLKCKNTLAGVILDRFGTDVMMIPVDEDHFKVKLLISVSPQFFGWITGIGKDMKILGPENVKAEYRSYLQQILDSMEI